MRSIPDGTHLGHRSSSQRTRLAGLPPRTQPVDSRITRKPRIRERVLVGCCRKFLTRAVRFSRAPVLPATPHWPVDTDSVEATDQHSPISLTRPVARHTAGRTKFSKKIPAER